MFFVMRISDGADFVTVNSQCVVRVIARLIGFSAVVNSFHFFSIHQVNRFYVSENVPYSLMMICNSK